MQLSGYGELQFFGNIVLFRSEVYVDIQHGALSFEREPEHESSGVEVVERAGIEVVIGNLEVGDAEGHLQFDGELDVTQVEVEPYACGIP